MSAPEVASDIVELAADGVADGMHIVGEEALAMEKAVRGLDGMTIGYIALGFAAGATAGALVAWKIAFQKAELKYSQIAEEEVAAMRDHYHRKAIAHEAAVDKPKVEDIVREKGYSGAPEPTESAEPPMAVTPPSAVVERAEEAKADEPETPPSPAEDPGPTERNVFQEYGRPETPDEWDWHKERSQRSPVRPYVIHVEEREEQQAYDEVTYTYYETDDVVCNDADEVISKEDRERILGEVNLNKFGHGSGDPSVVYIRNNQLEMDIEVVRSPNSYAEEVHGLEPQPEPGELRHGDFRRGRRGFDDD